MRGGARFPVRLQYAKRGKVRFLGHRDVARNIERAFRIQRFPLAFSEGFSPHPKISFGLALTTGFESDDEYLDVEFVETVDLEALPSVLTAALPPGITVLGAAALDERAPALQEAVTAVEWEVPVTDLDGSAAALGAVEAAIAAALAAEHLECTKVRKGRTSVDDIRPVIRRLAIVEPGAAPGVTSVAMPVAMPVVRMELATVLGKGAKPGEVLAAIGPFTTDRGLRTHQWIERDGMRIAPLHADTRPRVPQARAS